MFRIGVFSKMNQVTVKTLHYYEELGLLIPERVDTATGYRYYSSAQFSRLHHIISLRQMGLTLEEIAASLQGTSLAEVLRSKKEQLEEEIRDRRQKLSRVANYLNSTNKGKKSMIYKMVIRELPQVIVASRRLTIPNYDALFTVMPEMGEEMACLDCVCATPPYCFTIYHDGEYREENIDVEICEAVEKAKKDSGMVKFKTLSRIPQAVCALHKGPYSSLRKAYAAAIEWLEANEYEISGEIRESYIDGIWNKDSEKDWLTEIQIPVSAR